MTFAAKINAVFAGILTEEFTYEELGKDMWRQKQRDAHDKFKIQFDHENDDAVTSRTITIPQDFWDHTKCKFECELRKAGGDWEDPTAYFRCQLVKGYAYGVNGYSGSDKKYFCFIPSGDANPHLIKEKNSWRPPTQDDEESNQEPNEQKCWAQLKDYLADLVKQEIDRVKSESNHGAVAGDGEVRSSAGRRPAAAGGDA